LVKDQKTLLFFDRRDQSAREVAWETKYAASWPVDYPSKLSRMCIQKAQPVVALKKGMAVLGNPYKV
jgi:hypothetical protein